MMNYWLLHKEAAKRAVSALLRRPLATLLVVLTLSLTALLPLMLYLGVNALRPLSDKVNQPPQITLYIQNRAAGSDAGEADMSRLAQQLAQHTQIADYRFVSKDEGLAQLQADWDMADWRGLLDGNPLPDVFVVYPKDGLTPDQMQDLVQGLARLPMVAQAVQDDETVQILYRLNRLAGCVLWFLWLILGLVFVLVAYNTVYLQILSCQKEMEITQLLGAPPSFIRRPFLYQAIWQSLAAAGLSLGLCAWLVQLGRPVVADLSTLYGLETTWHFFHASEVVLVLLMMVLLGIFGAWLAVRQHLLVFQRKY